MPLPVTAKLLKPKSADEFEDIVTDVLARKLDTPIHRHGRNGQAQLGVDLYGKPRRLAGHHLGIQCKNVERLTVTQIKAEVAEAAKFLPVLAEYWIVTSLERDAPLQEELRRLNEQRRREDAFPIELLFWDDISRELAGHDDLLRKYGFLKEDPTQSRAELERHQIASRALTAALQCRRVTLAGVGLADHAKRAREATRQPRPFGSGAQWFDTFAPAMGKWTREFTTAKTEAEEVLLSMRVHWGIEHSPGIVGLVHLLGYLLEWNLKFVENASRLFKKPFQARKNVGPCNWDGVFKGEATERSQLTDALDQRLGEVEQWAKDYILTRSS